VIESLVSRRLEGNHRNKKKVAFDLENEAHQKARENKIMLKKRPSVGQSRVGEVIVDSNLAVDKDRWERLKEAVQKGKSLPYGDVPLKVTVWVPINPVDKEKQLVKQGPVTYKTRVPVEIGVGIEKIVESVLDSTSVFVFGHNWLQLQSVD